MVFCEHIKHFQGHAEHIYQHLYEMGDSIENRNCVLELADFIADEFLPALRNAVHSTAPRQQKKMGTDEWKNFIHLSPSEEVSRQSSPCDMEDAQSVTTDAHSSANSNIAPSEVTVPEMVQGLVLRERQQRIDAEKTDVTPATVSQTSISTPPPSESQLESQLEENNGADVEAADEPAPAPDPAPKVVAIARKKRTADCLEQAREDAQQVSVRIKKIRAMPSPPTPDTPPSSSPSTPAPPPYESSSAGNRRKNGHTEDAYAILQDIRDDKRNKRVLDIIQRRANSHLPGSIQGLQNLVERMDVHNICAETLQLFQIHTQGQQYNKRLLDIVTILSYNRCKALGVDTKELECLFQENNISSAHRRRFCNRCVELLQTDAYLVATLTTVFIRNTDANTWGNFMQEARAVCG